MSFDQQKPTGERPEEDDRFSAFDQPVRPDEAKAKKAGRFSRRTLTLLLTSGVAVVMALVVVLVMLLLPQEAMLSSGGTPESSAISATTYTLYNNSAIDPKAPVASLDMGGSYTIRYNKQDACYVITGYEDLALSQNIDSLIDAAILLKASDKVAQVDSLANFGLDEPIGSATVHYTDGSSVVLHFGDKAPSGNGYYVRLADSQDVYVVDTETAEYFLAPAWWYISTTLLSPPALRDGDENGTALLRSLTLTGRNHPTTFSLRRTTANDKKELTYFKYMTTKPYERGVTDAVGDYLFSFNALYAEKAAILHPTAAELEKYGFNDPYAVAKITLAVESASEVQNSVTGEKESVDIVYNNTEYTLTVGCLDADGNYVVMVDGINVIFLVEQAELRDIVERKHENSTIPLLFIKDITEISRVEMTDNGQKNVFTLTHHPNAEESDNMLTVQIGSKVYDTADFRDLYTMMTGLTRHSLPDTKPTGQPEVTLALYDLEGKEYFSASIYESTGTLSPCRSSDGELFTLKTSTVTALRTQLNNYLNGIAVPDT